jgi:hypothetical protein
MSQGVEIIAGLILLGQVVNAFMTFHSARKEATKPIEELRDADTKQIENIAQIRREIEVMKTDIDHAFDKYRALEMNNLVLEKAILALIEHELDGNHTAKLQESKEELENLIWHKTK